MTEGVCGENEWWFQQPYWGLHRGGEILGGDSII